MPASWCAAARISSFDQNPAKGKIPARARVPTQKVQVVCFIFFASPPISKMSYVWQACATLPAARKSRALKKACVVRWNIAAPAPSSPQAMIM